MIRYFSIRVDIDGHVTESCATAMDIAREYPGAAVNYSALHSMMAAKALVDVLLAAMWDGFSPQVLRDAIAMLPDDEHTRAVFGDCEMIRQARQRMQRFIPMTDK
jgi:hypothetical protein